MLDDQGGAAVGVWQVPGGSLPEVQGSVGREEDVWCHDR